MITKKALKKNAFKRSWELTNSAREAWSRIIEYYKIFNTNGKIFLPAYIGWSPNEGSGIFDSVSNSALDFEFYKLDYKLNIDFLDLQNKLEKSPKSLVLLVHYFGFVDSKYFKITNWLKEKEIFFVEDCAHAWLSDLIGGVCGRSGQYSFYSLHKLLPLSEGGILVNNHPEKSIDKFNENRINPIIDLSYDLFNIYKVRRKNYMYLCYLLAEVPKIEIIHSKLNDGICPQTLPVIIEDYDRNRLYEEMNESGFGMVSLYHTMIEPLKNYPSESASNLSKKIINFPVHQDINYAQFDEMVIRLKQLLNV